MKKSIFAFDVFHFKDFNIYSTNSTTIRIRKKRQQFLQNKDFAKYVKIKANDRSVKRYVLQALKQVFEYLRFFEIQQERIKKLKLNKLAKKRFDKKRFDKYIQLSQIVVILICSVI